MNAEQIWMQIWTRPGLATSLLIRADERIKEQVDELPVSWLEMKNDQDAVIRILVSAQNQAMEDYEQ